MSSSVYEMVTDRIIAQLEEGVIPWESRGLELWVEHLIGSARKTIPC